MNWLNLHTQFDCVCCVILIYANIVFRLEYIFFILHFILILAFYIVPFFFPLAFLFSYSITLHSFFLFLYRYSFFCFHIVIPFSVSYRYSFFSIPLFYSSISLSFPHSVILIFLIFPSILQHFSLSSYFFL